MSEEKKPVGEMPAVDFSQFNISDEEFAKATAEGGSYFRPGKHDVTVTEAVYDGQCESDDTWAKVKLTLSGTGDKTIDHWLLLPLKSHKFRTKKGTDTTFCFKKFTGFCAAMGVYVSKDNVPKIVKSFYPPATLVGVTFSVNMDYTRARPEQSKTNAGQYHVRLISGDTLTDDNGKEILFADPASAYAHGKDMVPPLDMDSRVSIVSFDKVPEQTASTNW